MSTRLLTFPQRNDFDPQDDVERRMENQKPIKITKELVDEVLLDSKINHIQAQVYRYKEGLINKKELVEKLKIIVGASESG